MVRPRPGWVQRAMDLTVICARKANTCVAGGNRAVRITLPIISRCAMVGITTVMVKQTRGFRPMPTATVITRSDRVGGRPYHCNDADKDIFPGKAEVCDGKDNDCDNQEDEGLSTDADKDGHYTIGSCLTPADDCNDGDESMHPGLAEICDGKTIIAMGIYRRTKLIMTMMVSLPARSAMTVIQTGNQDWPRSATVRTMTVITKSTKG